MENPKYSDLYTVILRILKDGEIHSKKELKQAVIEDFKLDLEAQQALLASGNQTILDSRVGWATTYLKKALVISSPDRGRFQITQRGTDLLAKFDEINEMVLLSFPEFKTFKQSRPSKGSPSDTGVAIKDTSPREVLEQAYQEYNQTLKEELLAELYRMDPYRFERLVLELLVKMGYGIPGPTGNWQKASNDEGIDGIISGDPLGFESIYIQAKRYQERNKVGRKELQSFVGALAGHGAKKGLFITTSSYTKGAIEFAEKNLNAKIVLVDGSSLAQFMIDHDLGVSIENTFHLKKLDSDFFED
ncbi:MULTISPECIES: restriction endonuclease [unclassified Streptococcus]|uniref:restriction endonuclease n=1 Tax=unclassified Streptococcus TaxID=2608887 RepID=UPI0018AC64CB|nr:MULTISPECIES: restriction endonuclease [unclassified Streptococcus]MBF8969738.1 restriction endonuclease [Streptococcus sp. NLN76]MBG9366657.1 restriction endonuclease [Streptococcus sp. NLN64]